MRIKPGFLAAAICFLLTVEIVHADLYKRAPDVLPLTTEEMRTPEYWIARTPNPDAVILTADQIMRRNEAFENRMKSPDQKIPDLWYWWPGPVFPIPDLTLISPAAAADTVRSRIKIQMDYLHSIPFGNVLGIQYSEKELKKFENEMALDTVEKRLVVRSGITVRTTRLRNIPSFFPEQMGLVEIGKCRYDLWNIGIVGLGKPVTVLYPSLSGEYLLILSSEGYGWVRSEDIAFGSADIIKKYTESESFIVCTGDRIQFYSEESCTYSSGFLRMGDRVPLAATNDPRRIKIPVREANGNFGTMTFWLPEKADVSIGWLPYTRRNVIQTAFKLLDNPYDWCGMSFGRHHETTYRDIFSVFGFRLPWHSNLFPLYGTNRDAVSPEDGREAQYRTILSHEPWLTIQGVGVYGHNQLFIGEHKGVPIVFDNHGYADLDWMGNELEIKRTCIGNMIVPSYMWKHPMTFLELK